MSTKKEDLKDSRIVDEKRKFRGKLAGKQPTVKKEDPGYEYRWVITDRDYGKQYNDEYERIEDFIDQGWNVVYSEERPIDERSNTPDNDVKNSDRLKPVTKRTKGGRTQVLMKCSKEQRQENEARKAKTDKARLEASVKSIKREGQNEVVTDHEIDASKFSH